MGTHESNKATNRRKIIKHARALIQEPGMSELPIRSLAARTQMSSVTIYNLFGSKAGLILEMLKEDRRAFDQRLADLKEKDSVQRLFATLSVMCAMNEEQSVYQRALHREYLSSRGTDLRAMIDTRRHTIWLPLVGAIAREGFFALPVDVELFTRNLENIYLTGMLHWTLDETSAARLHAEAGYGFALALRGVLVPRKRAALDARMAAFQTELLLNQE